MTVDLVKSEPAETSLKIDLLSPPQSATESTKQLSNDSSITSSPNSKSIDEHSDPKSPLSDDTNKTKLDTSSSSTDKNNISVTSSSNPVSSDSVSPNSENPRATLKRSRDSSSDERGSCESDRSNSSEQPAAKKVSYSIMNILGKEKEIEKKTTPAHSNQQPSMNPDISTLIKQQLASGASSGMNQFLMNPFLAAAAAFSHSSNTQQQPQLPPWFNMATMSSLCGLEKGVSSTNNSNTNGLPSAEHQNLQLQRQFQQHSKRTLNYSQSPTQQRTSSPANLESSSTQELPSHLVNPNTQLQLQIGQLVNNLIQQQHAHSDVDLNKRENDKKQSNQHSSNLLIKSEQNKLKIDSRMNVSDSSHSSSPLSMTPPLNQRYMISNEMRGLEEQRQKQFNGRLFMENNGQTRKSFNEDSGKNFNNGIINNGGGASLDDDSDNDDNLEEDEDDMDENGDSFDNGHRKKKTRTVFSRNQVFQLESTFDMKRYLSSSERSSLANSLQLTETQIKIWFQNRRNKWKRQLAAEIEANTNMPNMSQQVVSQHQLDSSNRLPFPRSTNNVNSNLANQNNNPTRNSMNHRLPVLFNTNQANENSLEQAQNHMASSGSNSSLSSSSTRSSLSSPSQNLQNNFNNPSALLNSMVHGQNGSHFNPAMLTPQMLAAASLYYAATGTQSPQSNNQVLAQFAALSNSQTGNNPKQSLSGML